MFISKKKFDEAIYKAIKAERERASNERDIRDNYRYTHDRIDRIARDFNARLRALEKVTGLVKEPGCPYANDEVSTPPIGY